MHKHSKYYYFTVDPRFHVNQLVGVAGVQRTQEGEGMLGFSFPLYHVTGMPNEKANDEVALKLFEQDLVSRILNGGDSFRIDTPSEAYTLRLLSVHYNELRTQHSRSIFIKNVLRILKKALESANQDLISPGYLDSALDPKLRHLVKPYNLLSTAIGWAQAKALDLKVARLQEKGPLVKDITLAYILLLEHGLLPPEYKSLTKNFAKYVVDCAKELEFSASISGVNNYLNVKNPDDKFFINTQTTFEKAVAWIKEFLPHIDVSTLKPLPKMVKNR